MSEAALFTGFGLSTARLRLRLFRREDAPAFHALASDPDVMRFLPEDVMTREESDRILAWLIESYGVNTPERIRKFSVAITLRDTGNLIGWCGLGPLDFDPSRIELYYGVSPSFWNRGYATEAAGALLRFGLDILGLPEIVAVVSPSNRASLQVLHKLRMAHAGELRSTAREHEFYEGFLLFTSIDPAGPQPAPRE